MINYTIQLRKLYNIILLKFKKKTMFNKSYCNFVRASSPEQPSETTKVSQLGLSGDEARSIYLQEVIDATSTAKPTTSKISKLQKKKKVNHKEKQDIELSNKEIFVSVQNNDIDKIRRVLDKYPDKINIIDDYGWSLLMIACQANSIDCTKELLKRGIDMSIRDKAGNSARSLVIKNKNYVLADILLEHKDTSSHATDIQDNSKRKTAIEYMCDICNKSFPDREEHLSSTLHNLCASKGKKIPANYVIPASNRGYQLMLKGGWDRDSGLGRNGSGKIYPIKTVQKKDRKGLGHKKRKQEDKPPEENIKHKCRKMFAENYKRDMRLEINFRREFY